MRTYKKTYLPDEIIYKGETYKMNGAISAAMALNNTPPETINQTLKKENRKGILVLVLANNLKEKTDLHGRPYQPNKWIFTNDKR